MNLIYCPKCYEETRYPPVMVFKSQEHKNGKVIQHYECPGCETKWSLYIGIMKEEDKGINGKRTSGKPL